jgi:hypothetical protein
MIEKPGKYTVFHINGLAMTSQEKIIVKKIPSDNAQGFMFAHTYPRKQKMYDTVKFLSKITNPVVFEGHDLPFMSDMETNVICGNACLNFVGDDINILKEYVETKSVNTLPDDTKGRILFFDKKKQAKSSPETLDEIVEIVYPEIEIHCAPIDRLKRKQTVKTIVCFQMTKTSAIEEVTFTNKPSNDKVEEYFENSCGGVYKWNFK